MTSRPDDTLVSADENRRMFDRLARRYDRMNRLISLGLDRRWRRKAVAMLAPRPAGRYLDIGCGTGDVMLEILRQCPAAEVVGIDPAEAMLRIARQKLASSGRVQVADAMDLPFGDDTLAGVITAFCFRNITDRGRALAEICRTLQPGGRVVILELTVPDGTLMRWGHRLYTRRIVPLLGRLVARDAAAYRYLVDSIEDLPRASRIVAMITATGFAATRATPLLGGTVTLFAADAP